MVLISTLSLETDVVLTGAVLVSKTFLVASEGDAKTLAGSRRIPWTYSSSKKSITVGAVCLWPEGSESAVATCFHELEQLGLVVMESSWARKKAFEGQTYRSTRSPKRDSSKGGK
jgi:hypothetical protein